MSFITIQFKSFAIMRGTTVKVILPTDAMAGKVVDPPYKTLYFLPGYSADATEILNYLSLRKQCELKGIAVVLVDGCNSFYIDHPESNQNFSQFIQDVVAQTRRTLPLSDKREDTFIGGISMGGYGALYNGMRFHETFSKICVLSPAVDCWDLMCGENTFPGFTPAHFEATFGSREKYENGGFDLFKVYSEEEKEMIPGIYMACGAQDPVLKGVHHLKQILEDRQIPLLYEEGDGNHELEYWENHLDSMFSFLADIEPGTRNRLVLGNFG